MIRERANKEYLFLLELKKPKVEDANDKVEFTNPKDKDNAPKCIQTKEENDKIVKVFKFDSKLIKDNKVSFEFFFDGKKYKLNLENIKDKTFIFDTVPQISNKKIEQKLSYPEKMNYFDEALNTQKEYKKLNLLYNDSIKICDKKKSFDFLINIFVKVYNTDLCSKLLEVFNKNLEKFADEINKEKLQKYKFAFNQICENIDDTISKLSLDKTDFYGLVLCYLNNCSTEKYKELFDSLVKNDENILFEVLLKYKLFFKKQIDINKELVSQIIKYSTKKSFETFKKDALFYLNDINTFLEIIEKNQEDIIKMKGFKPIEIPEIKDGENINFGIINPKIESITNFSKNQKKLLIYLKGKFWENLAKKCSGVSEDDIQICSFIRTLFNRYNSTIAGLFQKDDPIRKDINSSFKKGIFTHQIDKLVKEYIKSSPKITNVEIIELIRDYDKYYSEERYANKREPEILEKIDLEDINDNFIEKFKAMNFEKIFEKNLSNFLLTFTKKIKKISDFDNIFKLININNLGEKKSLYLKQLKSKYDIAIKSRVSELSENNENLIKSLVNLTTFICLNEGKIEFLEKTISKSNVLKPEIKHKIYIELIKFCKENKSDEIKKFIIQHFSNILNSGALRKNNLKEFIDFIANLSENDANDFIENIDNKFYIVEKEFYSTGENLNIQLFNELFNKQKLNIKDDNKYKKSNIKILTKIAKDKENKEIKFEYLKNFSKDNKEIIMEKLSTLTLVPDIDVNEDEYYEDYLKYYKEMNDTLIKLTEYKNSLELYHSVIKKDDIIKMSLNIETIQKETYSSFKGREAEIQDLFDGSVEIVNKVQGLSKIFPIFYQNEIQNNKNNKSSDIFDKAYEEFIKFKKKLVDLGPEFLKKDSGYSKSAVKNKIIDLSKVDKTIQKELTSLMSGEKQNEEEITIMMHEKDFEKDLNAIFEFFSCFKNNENLNRDLDEWKDKCKYISNVEDSTKMKNVLIELKKDGIYDYNKRIEKESDCIKLFNLFTENKEALAYLYQTTTEDLKPLEERIDPNGKDFNLKDFSCAMDCVHFFQELKKIEGGLKEVISHIKLKLNEKNSITLEKFRHYIDIFRSIKELNENFDFSENIYNDIEEVLKESKFIFIKNKDEFNVIKREKDIVKYDTISLEKIRELSNKIQLKQEEKKDFVSDESLNSYVKKREKLKFFKELAINIEEIHEVMDILRTKGSTLPISISIDISYPEVKYYLGQNEKKTDFKKIQKFLSDAKVNIKNKLDSVYKHLTTIRFLYGKQIDSILSHIQFSTKINSFLRYILNYTDSKEVKEGKKAFQKKTEDYINEINNYNSDSFNIIHDYILSLFYENKSSIKNHYKSISIKEEYEFELKGLFKYFSRADSLEEDILQIYLDKVGKIPIAQNILISSKETSYEEMQAFFHRAILCEENVLFIVELNGSFSPYQQRSMNSFIDKILTYLNNEYNKKNEDNNVDKSETHKYMKSCLVFVYNKKDESFLNELKQYNPKELEMPEMPPQNSLLNSNSKSSRSSRATTIFAPLKEELYKKTHIVQSEICGLGKTTQIKNKIKESSKKYEYFPLGGNITKKTIFKKLDEIMKKINSETKNNYDDIAIHLDLLDSKENIISILNEFLFSFLITKFYSNDENVIYIPTNIEIYIEIPNSFKDFISHYGILKSFIRENEMITIDNLPELNLPEDKINLFKNMLGISDNKEIYKWLKKKIKIERYSYHQIHIFINLFICQYNIFKGEKISFLGKNDEDVTDKCINSFAEATKYFTYGGFSKLLLEKNENQEKQKDEIDILSQEYDNDLQNEKFNKKLIFVVENKNGKFGNYRGIYYKLKLSEEALKKGEALGKLSEEEKNEREENMKGMPIEIFEKFEYLNILKTILDLENPVRTDEKTGETLKSLQEIVEKDDYIITMDNFRKMILILYRIIADIPVILMGETGCGKTALIKKLNQLLNNGEETLETINIDPSYNDEKLTQKMNEINDKAKKCKGELWVFFDEVNTCDSLSLITEIFINRTFGGKKLAKNVRIIGACNPYRKKNKNKNICGLTYNYGDENEVPLVYLVNILPQSLMYYVFNFGKLEKKNEDKYISSIISDIIPDQKLKEATKNVISKCHDYLKETFDPSVVSLREMKRFKKIYNFLIEYFGNKKKVQPEKSGNEESTKLKSIIISIYLNYYIRLVDEKTRTNFDAELQGLFKELVNYKFDKKSQENLNENDVIYDGDLKNDLKFNYNITDFSQFHFSNILSYEEDFILQNINLNKGIGKNKSLKENIFLLFTALVTNIPLIIIGKPGSSKTLSAQLIYKEMEGKYSKKEFFKLYPSIIQTYFQGSDSTKPKDVDDIFAKAEGRLEGQKKNKGTDLPISMILFDELGLAERSKYNPLKALHSHLELDGNTKGISFIGISNWILDAAKINRALVLSVPDLDSSLGDLKTTSISIAESINDNFGLNKIFNKILPNVYHEFKDNLKLLKILTVYKQYELQEYKNLIDKYKKDVDFQKIFPGIDLKNEENILKISEYETFKKKKNDLKKFIEEKKKKYLKKNKEKNSNINSEENLFLGEEILNNKDFQKLLENDRKIKEDFLGNRDFYYIIKGLANEMNDNNLDYKVIIKQYIERNFGGFKITIDFEKDYEFQKYKEEKYTKFLERILLKTEKTEWTSVQIFVIIFNIYCELNEEADSVIDEANLDDFNYMKNIIDNIKDIKSRYLLLGINSSLASLIHQKIEKDIGKKVYFHVGSPFPNDNSKEYLDKKIIEIQKHGESENGDIIILHNLNQVYPYLYDLFNKNFIKKDGKQYARISLGNYTEILAPINRSFRIIVMVNKNYLDKIEPPLLNRFEKILLSFRDLIDEEQNNFANIISSELDMKKYEDKLKYKINYRLKNLLIGCHKEHLLAMIYYELDSNDKNIKNPKNVKENIYKKIYKLLPQDIIVNLDDDNELKKLYNTKKEYYNLEQYLNTKPAYQISIIYTFSSIKTLINDVDESSSFKMISEIESENQLSRNIKNMITEKDDVKKKDKKIDKYKNYIFIHFDESNSDKIGFLINFVRINYTSNEELKFIFIVHIKRSFRVNKDNPSEKIFAVPDINTDIYQLFIDNLNGLNIKLNEVISNPIQNLRDKDLVNIEDEFNNALTKFTNDNLNNFYGENDKIDHDNYKERLEQLFQDDKFNELKKCIIKKIEEYIENPEENSMNVIENIYQNRLIDKDTVDLIEVIKDFVKKEIISKYINIILCKLEDKNILTTLLVLFNNKNLNNETLQETIKEMIIQYIEKINIKEDNYKPKFILSFIIPCFIEFYKAISDYIIQNIKNEFFKNEKMIRNFSSNKKNKKETEESYQKKEEYLLSLTYEKLEEDKFFFENIKKIPTDLILNDYITYFLIKYCSEDGDFENVANFYDLSYDDCKHKLINIILDIRFQSKKENDSIKFLLRKINWILGNKDYIKKILNIYGELKNIFQENEYIAIIQRTLKEQKLRYITHEKKNPAITTEVNECYYKIIASFCYSIIPPYIDFKKAIKTIDYIDSLKNAMKIIKGLNDDLNIFSIEVDLIEELIKIYDILSLNEKLDGDKLTEICSILKNSNLILQTNEQIQSEELVGEFKNLISSLNKTLTDNDKKYFELLKFIFFKETKKVPDVRYRAAIFQEVIKDAEVIINSNNILQILLFPIVKPKKDIFPKSILDILKATDYDVAVIIESILSQDENREEKIYNALNETLLYYFEKNSLIYFNDLFRGKEKILFENDEEAEDKKPENITGPLKLFSKCIKYLLDYNKGNAKLDGKNKNICKLFCLGYIRAYCSTFIDLIDSGSPNLKDSSKIIKEINNSKGLSKIISFYVWKAIYNKNKKNIDIFIDLEYITKYKLKEFSCFKNVEIYENPFSYDLINPQDKDIYDKFNQTLEKYREKKFEKVDLDEFKIDKIGIDIFCFSSNIFILSRLKQKQFINGPIYKNFFENVCTPLFKNNDKIFSAIKLLYEPKKYSKLQVELGINSDNLNIILHSYRYFINELYSNSSNTIYSVFYGRRLDQSKINNSLFPGNDIKNIPIHSLYSKIIDHFINIPNQGCFVCLCKEGGCYHSIQGGIPSEKYENLKCKSCGQDIGSKMNDRGFYSPIKRENYYRVLKTEEDAQRDEEKNGDKYNNMSLDDFRTNYVIPEFEEEKGIQKSDEDFFRKDSKIVRSLSQISYRILNYILYSHLLFSKVYNDTKNLDKYLPDKMTWTQVISECWSMINYELNKLGINSIDLFMNYIFLDLFSMLNKHKTITEYYELEEFEKNLDELIQKKILSFKENYKNLNKSMNDKFSFQDMIEEKYNDLNKNEYPFYEYFYYSDYINEAYLLDKVKSKKDKYPVLFRVLENNINKKENIYSLHNLPNFNEVLNLFSEKYFNSIKRDRALNLLLNDLKDEDIYNLNRNAIKAFIDFYNNLKYTDSKGQNLVLSEKSKLAYFFIDDQNEYGKSYKKIYSEFIKEQNSEISDLLDNKIENEVFERNCKDKINIQSANSNEVFVTNLSDKFSLVEVIFNNSFRKIAFDKNCNSYNQFEVDLNMIEDEITELLLRNKKLFNDSIINFVYSNEKLEFENTNIITQFNELYKNKIEKINLRDKIILYQFYQNNKEKGIEFFKNNIKDFYYLISFLIDNKKLLNEEKNGALNLKDDSRIIEVLEKITRKSENFDKFYEIFKDKDTLKISKTTYLFEFYRDLIFVKAKNSLMPFQNDLEAEQKEEIKNYFDKQNNETVITDKIFKCTIRAFIVQFLIFEEDQENNIKQNENNVINYFNNLDIPDIWDKTIPEKKGFNEELNNLKQLNVKVNQILTLYDLLGDDLDFKEVEKEIEKENEIKKIIEKPEPPKEEEDPLADQEDIESDNPYDDNNDDDESDNDNKYI